MKIGLDVDGVLTNLEKYQLEKGKEYFKDTKDIDETGYEIEDIFHCSHEESQKFWTKYIWEYCLSEPMVKNFSDIINLLQQEGDEIYIITRRVHTLRQDVLGLIFRKMLEKFLKKNNVNPESIYYCTENGGDHDKAKICKELGIDVMIEDDKDNCEILCNICNVICINTKYNQELKSNDNIVKVDSAEEVYLEIQKMKNNIIAPEEMSFYQDKFKKSYNKVRNIGVPMFEVALKPTILHKEYIPEEGPILLCGNHLHVWDQFPVICSTKRITHWMSKKEYFDSKLGLFFRKTGAISVDRFGNPHNATLEALNYLRIGSAVGLFPEGTRNHIKQEKIDEVYQNIKLEVSAEEFSDIIHKQNPLLSRLLLLEKLYHEKRITTKEFSDYLLDIEESLKICARTGIISSEEYDDSMLLPFKYGAVSMAKKTNAKIVPFGVTGDYKIGNDNLTVRFAESFKVKDMSLEEANQLLRNKVLTLVKQNLDR